MPQAYTISNQNGPAVSRGHNIRDPRSIKNQDHILPNGEHETWHDEKLKDAYTRIFKDAIDDYNQTARKDRRINNYYKDICENKKKNAVYEVIMTIGNRGMKIDPNIGKDILKEFVDDWKDRNPSLEMVGAYYHADEYDPETGIFGTPHVHIDYVPVAHNCERGPKVQTSLTAAFEEMGYKGSGPKNTAQMKWQRSERDAFEKICNKHGIKVSEKQRDERHHLDTEIYKKTKKLESMQEKTNMMEEYTSAMDDKIRNLDNEYDELSERLEEIRAIPISEEKVRANSTVKSTPEGPVVEVRMDDFIQMQVALFDLQEAKKRESKKDDEIARLNEEKERLNRTLTDTTDNFRQLGFYFQDYSKHVKKKAPKLNEEATAVAIKEQSERNKIRKPKIKDEEIR